jgi:hypothetical protein
VAAGLIPGQSPSYCIFRPHTELGSDSAVGAWLINTTELRSAVPPPVPFSSTPVPFELPPGAYVNTDPLVPAVGASLSTPG